MLGPLSNAASFLGLLEEDDVHLQSSALEQLDILVDEFWSEIADSISKMYVDNGAETIFSSKGDRGRV